MKKLYLIQLLLFISVVALAQPYETNPDFNRTRNWHFGDGVGLRFDLDSVILTNSAITQSEACAVHTDKNGDLLLYSNGEKIWNAHHEVIHNGNLSLGHNSSQLGSIFVFHEDNPDYIYLFNTNYSLSAKKELSFNLIVREADTFRFVFKDSVIQIGMSEAIAVVKADNGKDIWIVSHVYNGNKFIVYRLTGEGLVPCPNIVETRTFTGSQYFEAQFHMVFSSDGKYLMKVNEQKVELFSFNNRDGILKMLYSIGSLNAPVLGICFDPNNKNIFVAERDYDLSIYRFNPLDSFETVSSKKEIPLEGFKLTLGNMPFEHGIALVRVDTFSYLDFILNADDFDSVTLLEKRIKLNSYIGAALPNFNQSFFHNPNVNFSYEINCLTNKIKLYGQDTFKANTHSWEIFKNDSNLITDNIKSPVIEIKDTGLYYVRYIASNGSRSDTMIKTIEFFPKIETNFLGNDTGWCNSIGTSIELQAPSNMRCYEWNTGETTSQISINSTGLFIVKLTTPNFCVVYDTITLSIDTVETVANGFLGDNREWCSNIDTSVLLKAPLGFTYYKWSNGSNEQEINVSDEGQYSVVASKRNQCTDGGNLVARDTISVTHFTLPQKPTLNRTDDSLFITITGENNFKWFRNNTILSDTTKYLILPDTGTYHLEITNENNCKNHSDTLFIATLGLDKIIASNLTVFPNPTNGILNIEVSNELYTIEIHSLAGKYLLTKQLIYGSNQIDFGGFPNGIYFLIAKNNNQIATFKIIKIE